MMAAPPRTYRLAVGCPVCGSPPAIQVSELEAKMKAKLPAHWFVMQVTCVECVCYRSRFVTFDVFASAYQTANP